MAQKKKTSKSNRTAKQRQAQHYSPDSLFVYLLLGIICAAVGSLTLLGSLLGLKQEVFVLLRQFTSSIFGSMTICISAVLIWGGVLLLIAIRRKPRSKRLFWGFAVAVALISVLSSLVTFVPSSKGSLQLLDYIKEVTGSDEFGGMLSRSMEYGLKGHGGGLVGMLVAWPLWRFVGAVPGALLTGLALALDVVVAVWPLLRQLRPWLDQRQVEMQERHEQRMERNAEEKARREEEERRRQMAWEAEQQRQAEIMRQQQQCTGYQPGGPSPYARPGTQQVPVVATPPMQMRATVPPNGAATSSTAPTPSAMPTPGGTPTPSAMPMQNGQPVYQQGAESAMPVAGKKPVSSRRRRNVGFAPSADELEQPNRTDDWTTPRRKSAWNDAGAGFSFEEAVRQAQAQNGQAEPPEIPAYAMPKAPTVSGLGVPEDATWHQDAPMTYPQQTAPVAYQQMQEAPAQGMMQTMPAMQATAPVQPMASYSQPIIPVEQTMPTQPIAPVVQEEPEQTPVAEMLDDDADFPETLDDRPPWEDAPEAEEEKQAVSPVLTQVRPEGAWHADLKLPVQNSAPAQNSGGVSAIPAALQKQDSPLPDGKPTISVAKATTAAPSGGPSATGASAMSTFNPEVPYTYPPLTLLRGEQNADGVDVEEDALRTQRLEETLKSFRIPAKVRHITHGPAISRFELEIAPGIKVSKITNLNHNIAMNMAVNSVRIEAPIPGKSLVGVEVPNSKRTTITLREVLQSEAMYKAKGKLTVALGKDIAGAPIVCDLAKMPHLLIAGATGSGKSVCINTIINSLLFRCSPKEVRMILVDPKVVELQCYNGIPHLLIPVVSDPQKASGALAWAVDEMMKRYARFQEKGVRAIDGYNASLDEDEDPMPRIVIVIDELADLMMTCKKEVEERICRLAQLARAAGIHLIVATQRPSVDVITGLIKANIPSRIAFTVTSNIDSRTILDRVGAEELLGYGDMLYSPMGSFSPTRVQGCFLTDDEVNSITDFIRQYSPADYDRSVLDELDRLANMGNDGDEDDPDANSTVDEYSAADKDLFAQCVEMAVRDREISVSLIQRRLKLGYARAGRLVDEMQQRGIISAKDGAKPRRCLISPEQYEAMKASGEI